MSLDVYLEKVQPVEVFSANITHNLGSMADAAGIYQHLWRPEELDIELAEELIVPLRDGIALMKSDPARFKAFDAENHWGIYDDFLPWIERYLEACIDNPDAKITVSR